MDKTTTIDPTARVDSSADIGANVQIGPYCVVEKNCVIGDGTVLKNHVTVGPNSTLGRNNTIYSGASVGGDPQDVQWHGEETFLAMGDRNVIRESVTINRGTHKGDNYTRIGSGNLIMACSHVAHDCMLGDHIVIANNVLLAGHVIVHDRAILNGAAAVHQFTTVGRLAYVGGLTRIVQDVPPFVIVEGHPSKPRKINDIGLQRNGYTDEQINALKDAYKNLFRARGTRSGILREMDARTDLTPEVQELIEFVRRMNLGRYGRSRNV